MSSPVTLSVDGLPGLDGAASRDAHLVNPNTGHQVAEVSFFILLVDRPRVLRDCSSSARKW